MHLLPIPISADKHVAASLRNFPPTRQHLPRRFAPSENFAEPQLCGLLSCLASGCPNVDKFGGVAVGDSYPPVRGVGSGHTLRG